MNNFRLLVITSMMLVALPINTGAVFALGVGKVNRDGDLSTTTIPWIQQIGGNNEAFGITVDDSSGVYAAGGTDGALPGQTNLGDADAFVRKYDHQGKELWTQQFGSQ
jgi:hypothetical protein